MAVGSFGRRWVVSWVEKIFGLGIWGEWKIDIEWVRMNDGATTRV